MMPPGAMLVSVAMLPEEAMLIFMAYPANEAMKVSMAHAVAKDCINAHCLCCHQRPRQDPWCVLLTEAVWMSTVHATA